MGSLAALVRAGLVGADTRLTISAAARSGLSRSRVVSGFSRTRYYSASAFKCGRRSRTSAALFEFDWREPQVLDLIRPFARSISMREGKALQIESADKYSTTASSARVAFPLR